MMNLRQGILILICTIVIFTLNAQEVVQDGPSADLSKGRLKVSENGRFLQYENGDPFFYLGETAWEFFHRLSYQEAEMFLENRREKGFTVIQAVILAEENGLIAPSVNGEVPLVDLDPGKPNEKYFLFVDSLVELAASKGLYMGLLPTWGDKVDKQWGQGPVIFNPENAFLYGQFLGERYKDHPNIIWINGGDRQCKGNEAIWNALARGIRSVDDKHLMTFHPWVPVLHRNASRGKNGSISTCTNRDMGIVTFQTTGKSWPTMPFILPNPAWMLNPFMNHTPLAGIQKTVLPEMTRCAGLLTGRSSPGHTDILMAIIASGNFTPKR